MLTSLNAISLLILDYLLAEERSLDDIAKFLGVSKPNVKQKYLDELERRGLIEKKIVKTEVGRQARFMLKPFTLVLSMDPQSGSALCISDNSRIDLDRLLLQQVDPEFRRDIMKFVDNLDRRILDECIIILFGSVAIGKGVRKSDIDLLFLKEEWAEGKDLIESAIDNISLDVEHQISPIFKTKEEFMVKDTVLLKEIKKDGIIIRGGFGEDVAIWKTMKRYSGIMTSASIS